METWMKLTAVQSFVEKKKEEEYITNSEVKLARKFLERKQEKGIKLNNQCDFSSRHALI